MEEVPGLVGVPESCRAWLLKGRPGAAGRRLYASGLSPPVAAGSASRLIAGPETSLWSLSEAEPKLGPVSATTEGPAIACAAR